MAMQPFTAPSAKSESKPHFHIRWVLGALDWEGHRTRAEAEEAAKRLARPDEKYTIEEADETCMECKSLSRARVV